MKEVLELNDLKIGDILLNRDNIEVLKVSGVGIQSFLGFQKASVEDETFNSTEDKFAEVALYYLTRGNQEKINE